VGLLVEWPVVRYITQTSWARSFWINFLANRNRLENHGWRA
jgi:hypothetical protein